MKSKHKQEGNLVNERDIDKDFGLFTEDSYPEGITLPKGLEEEHPDGTREPTEKTDHAE